MPLLGKIVVIKRHGGGDGTEFPLTASCMFGRKLDCDICIQLPQVSKEHCKIELNENKELILTNLSSVNPTHINGQVLNQSERLKHGDLITIIDCSFRFEYPPPKTPKKKRLSTAGKDKTVQALQDQQEKSKKRRSLKSSAGEVVQQILLEPQSEDKTPKSPEGRRSVGSQDQSLDLQMPLGQPQTPGLIGKNTEVKMSPRTSVSSNAGNRSEVQGGPHEIKAIFSYRIKGQF